MKHAPPRTLYQKIWDTHAVAQLSESELLLYVDLHLINEVMSAQAFEGLRVANRMVRRPDRTLAVADHNVPTDGDRILPIPDPESRLQVETLERNAREFGIPYVPLASEDQGIVHIIGPELGLTLPGSVIVCGDSHSSTHGAFGALAFGIGTSEVEHVLVTQSLPQRPSRNMLVQVDGVLPDGASAKDLILTIIATLGAGGANGYVIEYAGEAIRALDMAGRMTVCNMSIEAGARAGMIAPDETTLAYIQGRRLAPSGENWKAALAYWQTLHSDEGASFEKVVTIDARQVVPMITWGTSPHTSIPLGAPVPALATTEAAGAHQTQAVLDYMGLEAGCALGDEPVDVVFIGSCTNGRLEDLRAAAAVVKGRRVSNSVRALVVPGSGQVKRAAEAEGLDQIFLDAGFEWREAGCSMCLGMNPDRLLPGQRCVSTSNRNFEGRQGPGGRTHLASPATAAAIAISGRIALPKERA